MKILVTGSAGFIGAFLCKRLLETTKDSIIGVDNLNDYKFDVVVNLAAQAGVRYSIDHPDVYISSNIIGFYNVLEAVRYHPVKH